MSSGFFRLPKRIHVNEGLLILRYGGINNYPLLKDIAPSDHRAVLMRIAYSRKHRFFYARVPKAANSTVVATLAAHMTGDDDGDNTLAKMSLNRLPSMRQLSRCYRFTVVRDPTTRIVSAYLDKICRPESKFVRLMKNAPDLSIDSFLRELERNDFFGNGHFLPQTRLLPGGVDFYDRIAKVETLQPDMAEICSSIFGQFDGLTREVSHGTGATAAQDSVIGPETRALIARLYANDFNALEYDAPA